MWVWIPDGNAISSSILHLNGSTDGAKRMDFAPLSDHKVVSIDGFPGSPTVNDWQVGGYSGFEWNGNIAELIIVDTDSSTGLRQTIEGYLAWKWGLVADLPAGHPYKSAPPTLSD